MPCPHNEITIVQRSQRQSAVAAAAYQSGEKLFCEYDQQVKHQPEKRGIVHNEILLPANAPQEYADRNTLSGYNTIKAKHPDLINEEWSTVENILLGLDPDKLLENGTEKAWWKCPICKHHYLMSVKDRLIKAKRKHNPCTFCNGRRIPSPHIILQPS